MLGSCVSSANNICRCGLDDEVRTTFELLREGLNVLADQIGSKDANAAEVLVELRCQSPLDAQRVLRHWCMLGKGSYKPKFQMWIPCDFPDRNALVVDSPDLVPPYEVDLRGGGGRLCPLDVVLAAWTSDELAQYLNSFSQAWSYLRCDYYIPHKGDLLANRVTGHAATARPLVVEKKKPVKLPAEFEELRRANARHLSAGLFGTFNNILLSTGRRSSESQPPAAKSSRGSSSGPRQAASAGPAADPDFANLAVVDENLDEHMDGVPADVIGDMADRLVELEGPDDIAIVDPEFDMDVDDTLEIREEPVAIVASDLPSSSVVCLSGAAMVADALPVGVAGPVDEAVPTPGLPSADDTVPPPPLPPPPERPEQPWYELAYDPQGLDIEGPSRLHYLYRGGRSIGKWQVTGNNVSIKCHMGHPKCSLLIYKTCAPTVEETKAWLASVPPTKPGDSKEVAKAKATLHLSKLEKLRDDRVASNARV